MLNTFIQMMVSITDPLAIERGYQILAAKRDLLAEGLAESTVQPIIHNKLGPSFQDVMTYRHHTGQFALRIVTATPQMELTGFPNGKLFKLVDGGRERSRVAAVIGGATAVVHNKHLESVFVYDCGCINHCECNDLI